MCSIAILLATYNSERFLREQLDSLLSQSFREFTIYIRDDGSSDSTIRIIREYCDIHKNIVLLNDSVTGRGAMGSFIWLLENTQADYYMFCDHDDFWLPQKVDKTYTKMRECEAENPHCAVAVNTDLVVADEALRVINPSFWAYSKINRAILSTFDYLAVCNSFTGCTMMINERAKMDSLPLNDKALMHDQWIALNVAAAKGTLGWVDEPTILYRQHTTNVVGANEVNGGYIRSKLMTLRKVVKLNRANLEMVRAVKPYGLCKYLWYKFIYFIKR